MDSPVMSFTYYGGKPFVPSNVSRVVVDSSVEAIAERAFSGCEGLKFVEFASAENLKLIDASAFFGCSSLTSIDIPSSVERIGSYAFCGCTLLKSAKIPSSVGTIGKCTFRLCPEIESQAVEIQCAMDNWLCDHIERLPLHHVCYKPDVTVHEIRECMKSYPDAVTMRDAFGRTALAVLAMNPKVEVEMVQILMKKHPKIAEFKGPLGMNPLHFACCNPGASMAIIQMLSDTSFTDPYLGIPLAMVTNDEDELPCAIALRNERPEEICHYLFALYPITMYVLISSRQRDNTITRDDWRNLSDTYLRDITGKTKDEVEALDPVRRHAWVHFVNGIDDQKIKTKIVARIKDEDTDPSVIRVLASFKDLHGRSAIGSATKEIREAMEDIVLFLGRYDLAKGAPLHQSATSILIKALDRRTEDKYREQFQRNLSRGKRTLGKLELQAVLNRLNIVIDDELFEENFKRWDRDGNEQISEDEFVEICVAEFDHGLPRQVVLKFMKDKNQFLREVDSRERKPLDPLFVIDISQQYVTKHMAGFKWREHESGVFRRMQSERGVGSEIHIGESHSVESGYIEHDPFLKALTSIRNDFPEILDYPHAIVMPCADRNLDTIFRNERPSEPKIRAFAKDLADAIQHVHSTGIIHGDIKLMNVVRFEGRLRLIDFDSAVKIDTPAGVKFSSGVLPPEMIARVSVNEYKRFISYFGNVKTNDAAYWRKISKNAPYLVKTFLTRKVSRESFLRGELVNKEVEEPVRRGLPYDLVDATPSIDIWSYGTVLYTLHTGSPLFDVTRDDDMKTVHEMRELREWNDVKKRTKLKKVRDQVARSFLNKLLSKSPSDRPESMADVLEDPYFTNHSSSEQIEKRLDELEVLLVNTRDTLLETIKASTTVTCKAVFEATEVETPTCFIVLPQKIVTPQLKNAEDVEETISRFAKIAGYIQDVIDKTTSCVSSPLEFASEYVKSQFIEETMWFYLIDEYTGEPVCVEGAYPVEIKVRSELAKQFLPVMSLGMQALSIANGAAGLVHMFYPAIPNHLIPQNLIKKAEKFIEETNRCGVVQQVANGGSGSNVTVRGPELRELATFLGEKDPECTYCGLRRVGDASGQAIWVTEESARLMEMENESDFKSDSAQVKHLKEKLEEAERKHLEYVKTINKLKSENEQMRADRGKMEDDLENARRNALNSEKEEMSVDNADAMRTTDYDLENSRTKKSCCKRLLARVSSSNDDH